MQLLLKARLQEVQILRQHLAVFLLGFPGELGAALPFPMAVQLIGVVPKFNAWRTAHFPHVIPSQIGVVILMRSIRRIDIGKNTYYRDDSTHVVLFQ